MYVSRKTTRFLCAAVLLASAAARPAVGDDQGPAKYKLATFSADVTIPLNHRCMGVLPTKSKRIVDRLYVHGFVLLGPEKPVVLCAVDWIGIGNDSLADWKK